MHHQFRAARRRALRSGFIVALAGLAATAALVPAWAEVLRAEGYYADLSVQLAGGEVLQAGTGRSLVAAVHNAGPDPALQPRLLLAADPGTLLSGEGCTVHAPGALQCALAALANGQQDPVAVLLQLDQDLRGMVAVGALASSGEQDLQPGNDIDATWFEVVGVHDLGVQFEEEYPTRLADGRLRWRARIDNSGPSSVLHVQPHVSVHHEDAIELVECRGYRGARCQEMGVAAYLPVDGWLEIDVILPAPQQPEAVIHITVASWGHDGVDAGTREDWAMATYATRIFSDRFGD